MLHSFSRRGGLDELRADDTKNENCDVVDWRRISLPRSFILRA